MVHTISGDVVIKKHRLNYNMDLNASLMDIKKYKHVKFKVCENSKKQMGKKKKFLLSAMKKMIVDLELKDI